MATVTTAEPTPSMWLKPWQVQLFAAPLALLATLVLILLLQKPDYMRLLWIEPMGLKMLVGALALLPVGAVLYLGGCLALNRTLARTAWGGGANVLQIGLVLVWVVLFCAPVAFVVLIGPAAIQIQKNLSAD